MAIVFPVSFIDSPNNPIFIRDKNLINQCSTFQNAVEGYDADWEINGVVVETPMPMPKRFTREVGHAAFNAIAMYQAPTRISNVTDYPELNQRSLEELREIIEFSVFLQSDKLLAIVGFVMARKLDNETFEYFANLIVREYIPSPEPVNDL